MRRINICWRDIPLFTGWVDDWAVTYEPGDTVSRVTASCVDGFAILANQELTQIAAAHSGDLSGARVSRVLDRLEVGFPASRSIDAGNSIFGATTFGANALAYLQDCARGEAGYLFVAADGTLMFRDRLAVLNVPSGATFTDDPLSSDIPYVEVTQRTSADLLFTRVTGEAETTGNEMVAADAAAKDDFLIRTLPLGTLLVSTDLQAQGLVDYYLERFSVPELRFQSATVKLVAVSEAQVAAVASLDLTDVVNVQRSPLNVGSMIERLSLIDGVSHRISPGSWIIELSFSNADTRAFLALDDPVFGELNANRLAF